MMTCAFINADGIVVNVISGALSPIEQQRFLADYAVLFGATNVITVESDQSVWIGGVYDVASQTFAPPPDPIVAPSPDQPAEGTPSAIAVIE